jgi:hypothetical protein
MTPAWRWTWRAVAVLFIAGALYHATALISPPFGRWAYPSTYPVWRHLMFVGINITFAVCFIRRPRWLVWPMALLTIHILSGHGVDAWRAWVDRGEIEWIHVATVLFSVGVLALVFVDRQPRREI